MADEIFKAKLQQISDNDTQIGTNDLEIKGQVNALLQYANGVTGEQDSRLGDAVYRLADGYGGGGEEELKFIEELTVDADTHEASYATRYVGRGFRDMQIEIVWAGTSQNASEAAVNVSFKGTNASGVGNVGAAQASVSWAAKKSGTTGDTMIRIGMPMMRIAKTVYYMLSNQSQGSFGSSGVPNGITELSGIVLWNTSAWVGAGTKIYVYAR